MSGPWINPPSGRNAQTFDSPTFTGPITISANSAGFADGTASTPSIPFASDADGSGSGLYRLAANTPAMAINGTGTMAWGAASTQYGSGISLQWSASTIGSASDVVIARASANSLIFNGTASSTVTGRTEINKAIASIADNTATATFTVTIPNAAHSASIMVILTGSLGAGGAIGANEATASACYNVAVTRTAGVNAVATISSVFGSAASAAVAGAATITVTGALSAISGAVGATNTFTVNVTIARGSGTSTNHTCFAYAKLLNANATGITIA